ncbi:MAG: YbbR-like domain-containing protein [Myxococcales bacterium]|nr:YbbR-like domain-containing protein [Myxococcales bacterium]
MAIGLDVRSALTENLYLKFLSFALALLLYSSFHGTQDAQRSISVNLLLVMPQDSGNRVLVSPVPETLRLTLRGPRSALDELRADDVGNIQVVLRSSSERRVRLEPAMVHVPPNVRVEQIDPPTIDLNWEDVVVRDLPVQVSVVGSPAQGFVVKNVPVAEPVRVRVRGPKSEIMVLQHVRADPFEVAGLVEGTYTRQLALDRPRGRVLMDTSSQSVQVTTEIAREVVERSFVKLPVAVVGNPKAKVQPAEVDVRLVCPTDIVRALRPEQIVPHVTLRPTTPNGSESLPIEVSVDKCEPHITPRTVVVRW